VGTLLSEMKWALYAPYSEGRLPVQEKVSFGQPEEKVKLDEIGDLYAGDARNPVAIINLDLKRMDKGSEGTKENFCFKMGKTDIQKMFEQIESIQKKIDTLY